jgi:hypothetical protein
MAPAVRIHPEARTTKGVSFMAKSILAGSPRKLTAAAASAIRGIKLFEERSDDFRYRQGAWLIPSENGVGVYEVRLGPVETCECKDHGFRHRACTHITAANIAQSKSVVCSCCGLRVLGRYTTEVTEDGELLSWYPGDVLCGTCVRGGFWV